jgi:hypothetical protein
MITKKPYIAQTILPVSIATVRDPETIATGFKRRTSQSNPIKRWPNKRWSKKIFEELAGY